MSCVACNRPKTVATTPVTVEQGEAFLCWYCRATRVASAAKIVSDILDQEEHDTADLVAAQDILKAELEQFYYAGMSLSQLKKPIKGLEDAR